MDESISLNKFISDTGYCSRREADNLITSGRVLLNNRVAALGNRYKPGDKVIVDGSLVIAAKKEKRVYLALNKPVGITTTTELHIKDNIISFVGYPKRIFPIGRLDKDSEGLILLTNDGDIINKILRSDNNHEKEYIVRVNKPTDTAFLQQLSQGVPILDTVTLPCKVQTMGRQTFRITLTQGLNRQIRRMCEHLGYAVVGLQRVRIMNIKLDKLAVGKWRYLSEAELEVLMETIADSSKVEKTEKATTKEKPTRSGPRPGKDKPAQGKEKPDFDKEKRVPFWKKEKPVKEKDKRAHGKDKPAYAKDKTYSKDKPTYSKDKPAHAAAKGVPSKRAATTGNARKEGSRTSEEKEVKRSGPPKKGSYKDFRRKGRH